MSEPSRRSSRLALAGGLGAALLCTGLGFAIGRSTVPAAVAPPVPSVSSSAIPTPTATPTPLAATPSVLTRAELIAASRIAIDGMAGGVDPAPRMLAFEGRRFELRLPFGCAGPSADEAAPLRWRYDEGSSTLRVDVAPVAWAPADWLAADAQPAVEHIEGFWIARPWTSSEACPVPTAGAPSDSGAPPHQTLGLAVFASASASRVGRRPGEAFSTVKKVRPDEIDLSRGLRLRLTGRIAGAPGAGPVICRALDGPDHRPTCLVAVALDEVAIETGATGEVLATWTVSQQADQSSLGAR